MYVINMRKIQPGIRLLYMSFLKGVKYDFFFLLSQCIFLILLIIKKSKILLSNELSCCTDLVYVDVSIYSTVPANSATALEFVTEFFNFALLIVF
jgi:hypothetical protein